MIWNIETKEQNQKKSKELKVFSQNFAVKVFNQIGFPNALLYKIHLISLERFMLHAKMFDKKKKGDLIFIEQKTT